jgi:hypothetical protein
MRYTMDMIMRATSYYWYFSIDSSVAEGSRSI